MSDDAHWQLDGSAPELYQRYLVPAITSIWAADLVDRAKPREGQSVLDIACGTGVVARLAAQRVASGRVVGLDLNDAMLAVARSQPAGGAPIEWMQGSALALPFPDRTFDLVLCQLGLQFFPDKPLALREMHRVLVPAGGVALSVYSSIERTPAASAFADALDHCLGVGSSRIKRGEHIYPAASDVASLMMEAGFEQVEVATVTKRIIFPSVLDYVRFQLVATPMASLLADRDAARRETAIAAVSAETQSRLDPEMLRDGRLSFPQEAHVALARRPPEPAAH
jgi:ubiquinone/menaquinone biosynthesis C-methylase UbiE